VPGISVAREPRSSGDTLLLENAFERIEPMYVIGLARIGIAGRLRALDLGGEDGGPFRPGEQPTIVERECHGKSLRLPRLAKYGTFAVARNPGNRLRRLPPGVASHRALRDGRVTPAQDKARRRR